MPLLSLNPLASVHLERENTSIADMELPIRGGSLFTDEDDKQNGSTNQRAL
jgi:hypothetical protein